MNATIFCMKCLISLHQADLAGGDRELFRPIVDNLLWHDPFMVLADYQDYIDCQDKVSALWRDQAGMDKKVDPECGQDG